MSAFFAPLAFIPSGWAAEVRIDTDAAGTITAVTPSGEAVGARHLTGPVLPGMPNLHSHAFQRAIAGHAERAGPRADDFWTWREAMYEVALCLDADALEAIAAELYAEMLQAGYTTVVEFHYLHHDPRHRSYTNPAELSERLIAAARRAGIALTLLPVLYCHGGFGAAPPALRQARFLLKPERYLALLDQLRGAYAGEPLLRFGLAPHSLRAVDPAALREILAAAPPCSPIHIHAAEQIQEVEECQAALGARPVEWLLGEAGAGPGWTLIHATHMTESEIHRLAASGAIAGLCPTTEANLGDGIFPATEFLAAGGRFGIGSDSQISTDPAAELCLLEYAQRLSRRRRAVLATQPGASTGETLYSAALAGGAAASAQPVGAIAPGRRADFIVLDPDSPHLAGHGPPSLLDAFVFATPRPAIKEVFVAGRSVVQEGKNVADETITRAFRAAIARLALG